MKKHTDTPGTEACGCELKCHMDIEYLPEPDPVPEE